VPHLARCRTVCRNPISGLPLRLAQQASGLPLCAFTSGDESVLRDYVEIAWAHSIRYGTALIENVLGPRLEVVAVDDSQFKLQNLSRQEMRFSSEAVEIVYETPDPVTNGTRRVRVPVQCSGIEPHVLTPSIRFGEPGPESSFTCSLPASVPEAPVDRRTFWVVVRGALGGRGEVGTSAEFDARQKSYAVAVRKVIGSEVFYGGRTVVAGADPDMSEQLDIHTLSLDPTLNLTAEDPNSVAVNVTSGVRAALGDGSLDFSYPSAQPNGSFVAVRADSGATDQTFDATTNGDKQALFVLDPTVEPTDTAALTEVSLCTGVGPCVRHEARVLASPRNSFHLQWSIDGEAIVARGPGGDAFITDAPGHGTTSRRILISASNGLAPESPNEVEACVERPSISVSLLSATRVAASAACTRTRYLPLPGGANVGEQMQSGADVLIASLTPSTLLPDALVPQALERLDVQASLIRSCGPCTGPNCTQETFDCGETVESEGEVDTAWSPDGLRLAAVGQWEVSSVWTGGRDLWVVDPSGAARTVLQLLPGEGLIRSPVWAPDGEWIAVVIGKTETDSDIYLIDPNGPASQAPRRVTKGLEVQNAITWRSRSPLRLPTVGP
jgi:hypothetical protein